METLVICKCGTRFNTDKGFDECYHCLDKNNDKTVDDFIMYICDINTYEKAYIVGWLFGITDHDYTGDIDKFSFETKNIHNCKVLRDFKGCGFVRTTKGKECITIQADTMFKICSSFNKLKYSSYIKKYKELFFRGYFEAFYILNINYPAYKDIKLSDTGVKYTQDEYFNNSFTDTDNLLDNIDFIGKFYITNLYLTHPTLFKCLDRVGEIKVVKKDSKAVLPSKPNESDTGFDLTVIKKVKDLTDNTELWDTGLMVIPPKGYYIEIVPRSSISKSGYMLANNIGIIDSGYRGNLMIALIKVSKTAKPLNEPWRCCQMILRKHENSYIQEYSSLDEITQRNTGGFGSSN